MKPQKIIFLGDVHGDWTALNYFIAEHDPDMLFIAGDVGYFWKHNPADSIGKIKPGRTKVYWIAGNHENHDIVKNTDRFPYGKIHKLEKNIYFCAFGSTLKLKDGRKILFCGGADSIDKQYRIIGKSWWRKETIQSDEFDYVFKNQKKIGKVDIILSHTCPTFFDLHVNGYLSEKYKDPSCDALDEIFKMFDPSLWFFGHFHVYDRNKIFGCEWFALACLGDGSQGLYGYRILDNLDYNDEVLHQEQVIFERRQEAYRQENERRNKDPNYEPLSLWPDDLKKPLIIMDNDLDF